MDLLSSDFLFFDLSSSLLLSSLLFSDSSHLCFSFVHIAGILTSKPPSIIMFCFLTEGNGILCCSCQVEDIYKPAASKRGLKQTSGRSSDWSSFSAILLWLVSGDSNTLSPKRTILCFLWVYCEHKVWSVLQSSYVAIVLSIVSLFDKHLFWWIPIIWRDVPVWSWDLTWYLDTFPAYLVSENFMLSWTVSEVL